MGEIVRPALQKGPAVYLTEQPPASFRVALGRADLLGRENLFVLPANAVKTFVYARSKVFVREGKAHSSGTETGGRGHIPKERQQVRLLKYLGSAPRGSPKSGQ